MAKCAQRYCRARTILDADGFCAKHPQSTTDDQDEQEEVNCDHCHYNGIPEDSQAIMCEAESCKLWFHLTCTNISDALYNAMSECSKTEDLWYPLVMFQM